MTNSAKGYKTRLKAFASRPIPPMKPLLMKKQGYADCPINRQAPEYKTPCLNLNAMGLKGRNHYSHADNPPYYKAVPGAISSLYARKPVAMKLLDVQNILQPLGLGLYLFDAWRPDAVQRYFHDLWFPDWLRQRYPNLSETALMQEVERYWAPPSDDKVVAPHKTGAAVDLSLHYLSSGQIVFAGSLFDELGKSAQTDYFERRNHTLSMSEEAARRYRRILYWSLHEAGFANNPAEWWHYSWGDQMWAKLTGEKAALFADCNPLTV